MPPSPTHFPTAFPNPKARYESRKKQSNTQEKDSVVEVACVGYVSEPRIKPLKAKCPALIILSLTSGQRESIPRRMRGKIAHNHNKVTPKGDSGGTVDR